MVASTTRRSLEPSERNDTMAGELLEDWADGGAWSGMETPGRFHSRSFPGQAMRPGVRPFGSAPRKPRVRGACARYLRTHVEASYHVAYQLVVDSLRDLGRSAARGRRATAAWDRGPARRFFGPWSKTSVVQVLRVYTRVLRRFQIGFKVRVGSRPVSFRCFGPGEDHGQCDEGLLANARIRGTIRFCPRVLDRSDVPLPLIILHEMMHHGLGLRDRRHPICSGNKHRCYRGNAERLVREELYGVALTNIDNYVGYAEAASRGSLAAIAGTAPTHGGPTSRDCGCHQCSAADRYERRVSGRRRQIERVRRLHSANLVWAHDEAATRDEEDDFEELADADHDLAAVITGDDRGKTARPPHGLRGSFHPFDFREGIERPDPDKGPTTPGGRPADSPFTPVIPSVPKTAQGKPRYQEVDPEGRSPIINGLTIEVVHPDGDAALPAGCREEVVAAVTLAYAWARCAERAIDVVVAERSKVGSRWLHHLQGTGDRGPFATWMGESPRSNYEVQKVRHRIGRIRGYLGGDCRIRVFPCVPGPRLFEGYCKQDEDKQQPAYTVAPWIYICPSFFELNITARAWLITHELVHRYLQPRAGILAAFGAAFFGIIGGYIMLGHPIVGGERVTGEEDSELARALARRRSWAARRSPVNYALMFEDIANRSSVFLDDVGCYPSVDDGVCRPDSFQCD